MIPDDPAKHLAAALGRIPSGIFVLTVAHGGIETGMLASWVQQCSFKPPRLTVAVAPVRHIGKLLAPGVGFTLNILESSQTDMVAHFGKGFSAGEDAFRGLAVERHDGRAPVLTEALAYLECTVVGRAPAATTTCSSPTSAPAASSTTAKPMVHIRKNGLHY